MSDRVVLGSGKLYIAEAVAAVGGGYTIPEDNVLEVASNLIGWIQGGATLEYTPEFYTAKDDLGKVSKKYLTNETAILKSGVMTWNGETLARLTATADVTEDKVSHKRVVKLGGIDNFDNTQYVIRFLHEDETDGNVRVTIVGSNESGFEMQFAKDKETVINAEFKATPNDERGTLVIYSEDDASLVEYQDVAVTVGGSDGEVSTGAITGHTIDTAVSSDTTKATVSISNNKVKVHPVAAGTCKVACKESDNTILILNVTVASA